MANLSEVCYGKTASLGRRWPQLAGRPLGFRPHIADLTIESGRVALRINLKASTNGMHNRDAVIVAHVLAEVSTAHLTALWTFKRFGPLVDHRARNQPGSL